MKIQNFGNGFAVAWLRLLVTRPNNGSAGEDQRGRRDIIFIWDRVAKTVPRINKRDNFENRTLNTNGKKNSIDIIICSRLQ